MSTLTTRTEQVKALTEADREEYSDTNPIIFAEQGPNRYSFITLFFPEDDGVRITEDLDLGDIEVIYFDTTGKEQEIKEGALYEWAFDYYQSN